MCQALHRLADGIGTPPRVLLSSVLRPLGEDHGDSPSVGYELLHGQVTRSQGIFSPRSLHPQFSLDYIAVNLDAPTTVLQYPSVSEFIRELKRGYEYVGLSFILATFHKMKVMVALIREHAPGAEIVLGGYGTVLSDEVLAPYGDHVCREEGVAFMRRLLAESPREMPYRHPIVINSLKIFRRTAGRTGVVFAGLGCANGCDFCCTSHFFKRKHIRLLPTGRDIYDVIMRYLEIDPNMSILIQDEDFLLNRKRAMEFRDCVVEGRKALSIFCFASIRALSRFTVTEIMEMGIDGMWIGYEGRRSGYAKQMGRPIDEVFREFKDHGVTILASMIVGFPYQTPAIIQEELDSLLALRPCFSQFLIYGPVPGTPFFQRVEAEDLFHDYVHEEPERFYWSGTGFHSVVKHDKMSAGQIEAIQRHCFVEDVRRLGPSIYRVVETWLNGYLKWRHSPVAIMRAKAERFARDLRFAYPVFLPGRLFARGRAVRKGIGDLEARVHEAIGRPSLAERIRAVAAVGAAVWTGVTLKLRWFQHPRLVRKEHGVGASQRLRGWRPLESLPVVARRGGRERTDPEVTAVQNTGSH